MQSYLGTNASGNNVGLLACSDNSVPQGVVVCGTSTAAGQLVGVYDNNPSQLSTSPSVIPIRYGRALIKNFGSAAVWTSGDYVCRDTTNNGYVVDNSTTPCNRGTYVGVSAGDPTGIGSTNSHAVDLIQEPITQGGALLAFYCTGTVASNSTLYMFPSATSTTCSLATTSSIEPVGFSGTIKNLEVYYGAAPGTGHTDTFTVFKCPLLASCAATAVTCSISGTTTPSTCSDVSRTASISQGDGIQIQDVTATGSGGSGARITIQIQ